MKILVVCQHYPYCLGRSLTYNFNRLGVDVRHIGPDMGDNTHIGEKRYPQHVWHSQGDWHTAWPDWTPDIVLYAETLHVHYRHEVYDAVPHVQFNSAGPMDAPMPGIDWTFTAVSFGGIWSKTTRISWIPCAYNKRWITPSPIPWAEREYDVCLVGRLDSVRKALLERLEDAGLKIFAAVGLVFEDYAAAYHNARMGLVQTVRRTVPMRVFETPALGVLALSPVYPEYEALGVCGYLPFIEVYPDTLIASAQAALDSPTMATRLIDQGLHWSEQHSWQARAKTILEIIDTQILR